MAGRGLRLCAAAVAVAAACALPALAQTVFQDASVVSDVRLAARGGDFAEAFDRIDRIGTAGLKSKAHAALAGEYAFAGEDELAKEQFAVAVDLAKQAPMSRFERVSAYAFLAAEQAKHKDHESDARDSLAKGVALSERLAGFEHDIALAELAFAAVDTLDEAELASDLADRMSDPQFRSKVKAHIEGSR